MFRLAKVVSVVVGAGLVAWFSALAIYWLWRSFSDPNIPAVDGALVAIGNVLLAVVVFFLFRAFMRWVDRHRP
jgi:hypothetical protein